MKARTSSTARNRHFPPQSPRTLHQREMRGRGRIGERVRSSSRVGVSFDGKVSFCSASARYFPSRRMEQKLLSEPLHGRSTSPLTHRHDLQLRPRGQPRTASHPPPPRSPLPHPIVSYSLTVEPEKHFINWQQDPLSNYLGRTSFFLTKPDHLQAVVEVVAEMSGLQSLRFLPGSRQPKNIPSRMNREWRTTLRPIPSDDSQAEEFAAYLKAVDLSKRRTIDFLVDLNTRVAERHRVSHPHGARRAEAGRDAGQTIGLLPRLGLAALPAPAPLRHSRPASSPATSSSSRPDVKVPRRPFRGGGGFHRPARLDAKSTCREPAGSASTPPRACSRAKATSPSPATPDPASAAAPISGTSEKCETTFPSSTMVVRRVHESPRVTKPYSEEEWREIITLGDRVDEHLTEGDVRLTMGGEPTFVSIDDMDRRGMERRRPRPPQAHPRGRSRQTPAQALRAGRTSSLRTGKMVSRRAASALGLWVLLARRRRPDLGRHGPRRPGGKRLRHHRGRRGPFPRRPRHPPRHRGEIHHAGV